jgi:hypothetical protein
MSQGFDGMRQDMTKLSQTVQQDPSKALWFDALIPQSLGKIKDPAERQQAEHWAKQQLEKDATLKTMLGLGSLGLMVGSAFAGPLGWGARAAQVLFAGGVTLGAAKVIAEFPQVQTMDLAARAGALGGEKLTHQSPEEARMNLAMGYANLAIVGVDLGLAPAAVRGLMKMPEMAQSVTKMSRGDLRQVWQWAREGGASGIARARALLDKVMGFPKENAERLIQAMRQRLPQAETVGVPSGQSAVKTTEENVKDARALQAKTKGGGSGKSKQPPKPQAPSTPELPEFKDIKLGKKLGSGGNKTAFEVPGREDIAIAVLEKGKPADAINKEIGLLNELKEQGLPTVEVLGTTTHNGQPAMVMKKYAQGSKDVVELGENGKMQIVGQSKLLNEKSIADLRKIRSLMEEKKIKVDDLQFLIQKDGTIVIADPLKVNFKTPLSTNNKKTIDLLIESAQKNLNNR